MERAAAGVGMPAAVVRKHRLVLVMQTAAKEFWSVGPERKKVIPFSAVNAEPMAAAASR